MHMPKLRRLTREETEVSLPKRQPTREETEVSLPKHGWAHAYGGEDPIPDFSIDPRQIKPLGWFRVLFFIPQVATGGQPPRPLEMFSSKSFVPLATTITWEGTFGPNEIVETRIVAVYNDGYTKTILRGAQAPTTITLNTADLADLYENNKYIHRFQVMASSTLPSPTSVSVKVLIYALEI